MIKQNSWLSPPVNRITMYVSTESTGCAWPAKWRCALLVPVDAQCCGTPIVATKVGGVSDVVWWVRNGIIVGCKMIRRQFYRTFITCWGWTTKKKCRRERMQFVMEIWVWQTFGKWFSQTLLWALEVRKNGSACLNNCVIEAYKLKMKWIPEGTKPTINTTKRC